MKILVTGGAGYIGSGLLPLLLSRGHQVRLLDIFKWGVQPILSCAKNENLEIIAKDIRDAQVVQDAMKGQDLVIHLAGIVGYPACASEPRVATEINVLGTRHVVDALQGRPSIFASTCSVYGKAEEFVCTEESPLSPLTLYASNKVEGEVMMREAGAVALRFATLFGISPRLRLDLLVNDFVWQAIHRRQLILYESKFRRTFVHVSDAVASILFAMDHFSDMRGEAYNVCDEAATLSKLELAQEIRKYLDFYLHEAAVGKDLDQRDYKLSGRRLAKMGFTTSVTLAAGIEELIRVARHIRFAEQWRNAS